MERKSLSQKKTGQSKMMWVTTLTTVKNFRTAVLVASTQSSVIDELRQRYQAKLSVRLVDVVYLGNFYTRHA